MRDSYSNGYANSRREFQLSTACHEMTVLHDDGLYRHLRFAKPGTGIYRFDLVTWPGHLSITGDLEGYTFCREPDMFGFFAGCDGDINPGYWAEKLVAKSVVKEFDEDSFTQLVVDDFMERRHDYSEAAPIFRAIRDRVLDDLHGYSEQEARERLEQFDYCGPNGEVFEYSDVWEWDLTDWSVHYLRALQAIVWGINQYRTAKAVAA